MGKTNSKHSEVTDTGVVNSNFIVEENEVQVPLDIKILAYVAVGAIITILGLKLRKALRRSMKRNLTRSMMLRSQAADV